MKYLPLLSFLVCLSALNGQNVWLKGYGGIGREPQLKLTNNVTPFVFINSSSSTSKSFVMPALAIESKTGDFFELGFSWSNNKKAHVFSAKEVPPSDSLQVVDVGNTTWNSYDAVLEYNFQLSKKNAGRWKTFLGLTLNPHWSKLDFAPHQTYLYPQKAYYTGAHWGMTPRIQFRCTKNIFLDLNAALFLISTNYEHTRNEDPTLSINSQTNSIFEVALLKQYWLRIGVAWKIWGKKPKK